MNKYDVCAVFCCCCCCWPQVAAALATTAAAAAVTRVAVSLGDCRAGLAGTRMDAPPHYLPATVFIRVCVCVCVCACVALCECSSTTSCRMCGGVVVGFSRR